MSWAGNLVRQVQTVKKYIQPLGGVKTPLLYGKK